MPEVTLSESGPGPVLSNGHVAATVHLNRGTFAITDERTGREVVSDAGIAVSLSAGSVFSTRGAGLVISGETPVDDALGRGLSLLLSRATDEHEPELVLTLTLYEALPSVVIQIEVVNTAPASMQVVAFHVLASGTIGLGSPADTWRFYKHGWQSWSPTLVLDCAGQDVPMAAPVIAPGTQPEIREDRFVSDLMTAIVSPVSAQGLVAGFITTNDQLAQLWFDREPATLTAASYADGISVPPGGSLASERLLIEPTQSPLESMERYGDTLGRAMGARPSADIASGWCSWYYYCQGVTEGAVLENLAELVARPNELQLEYVQIDDGWQAEIGDWLIVNEKFPHGLKWLVDRIHEAGFEAGLWLAPFLAGEKSRLWRDHPEWAVQHPSGRPFIAMQNWNQNCYALDLTRPEVIDWLKLVFRTVCDDWGFDYVKIDFIYAGAVDGIRHDPEVTRAQAYRQGLEAIREAVGDRFVLACGNPIGPSVGLVDGARISPDVAPFWHPPGSARDPARSRMSEPSALNAIRNSITRWWIHGRLWQNDPDCLLARDSETALTKDEVRTLTTVIAMSGGMVLDSDDLPRLSEERQEWLSRLLPAYGKAARPLDLFDSEMPHLLELDVGTHRMIALFNWDDKMTKVQTPLPSGRVHVFDAWSREDLGVIEGPVSLDIPAHGCRLLAIRPLDGATGNAGRELPPLFRWPVS